MSSSLYVIDVTTIFTQELLTEFVFLEVNFLGVDHFGPFLKRNLIALHSSTKAGERRKMDGAMSCVCMSRRVCVWWRGVGLKWRRGRNAMQ